MPDLFYLISRWWKQITGMVLIATAVATTIVLLQPGKYLATTTALAASPYLNDKGGIFNKNIQSLYPSIGTSDELDVILSTAQLDTLFISVSEQLDLTNHYKMKEKGQAAIAKAATLLKSDTRIRKGDYGELKIRVWHEDKSLSPRIANTIAEKLQKIHQDIQNANNISILNTIISARSRIKTEIDSIDGLTSLSGSSDINSIQKNALYNQLQQFELLSAEYALVVERNPPALIIVEYARATEWPDKPKRLLVIVTTLVLSLLFSLLVILVLERRKIRAS